MSAPIKFRYFRTLNKFHSVLGDTRMQLFKRAENDSRWLNIVHFLDEAAAEQMGLKTELTAMDGPYYRDQRFQAFCFAAQSAITLATTDKLLYPGAMTALPGGYFNAGKAVKLTIYGAFTTGATPGNLGQEMYYGTTDAGGTLLNAASAAPALTASRTSMSVKIDAYCRCRTGGASGTLMAWALGMYGGASTNDLLATPGVFTPASAPAATTVDCTASSGFNVQIKRSGSTAETFTTHDLYFEALC